LTLNAELPAPGIARKRRGVVTDVDIDMFVGAVAPYRFFSWKAPNGTTYRIVCGSDAEAFVNGFNNYLYIRDGAHTSGAIYSDAEAAPMQVAAAWGLDAPTTLGVMSHADGAGNLSCLAAGYYRMAVASFDKDRWVESPALFLMGTERAGLYTALHTDQMQQISGVSEVITVPAITTTAAFVRVYRGNPMGGSEWPLVMPHLITPFRYLRLVDEKTLLEAAAGWSDHGGQVEGRVLDYATTVVPRCRSALFHDGRWWHTRTTAGDYKVFYTRGICPEIYAAVEHAILQEQAAGLERGVAEFIVPTGCGPITGQVALGGEHLILCRYGSWPVQQAKEVGLYDVGRNLWVGCTSEATVADSPWGIWWVAEEGIVLWNGQGPPQVLSLASLDIEDADTLFATDLSGAMATFDVKHRRYVCVVPKSGGGQIILTVQADLLPGEFGLSLWTLSTDTAVGLGTITGIGYDWAAGEVVFVFAAVGQNPMTAKTFKDACHRDGLDTGAGLAFDFKLEPWALANQGGAGPGEQKADLGLRVIVHRDDVTASQSVAVALAGLKTTEEAGTPASTATGTITWAAGQYGPKRFPGGPVIGRMVRAVLTNTDIYPLEIREVQVGSGQELKEADERPG
jgi:hypothetical protein